MNQVGETVVMASFLTRVSVMIVVIGGLTVLALWQWSASESARLRQKLEQVQAELTEKLAQRQAMIERLSRTRRVGHIEITDQQQNPDGSVANTTVLFVEMDETGRELGRQTFQVPGETVFFDAWTVKFDPERVAEGNPLRGRTLVLFRRVYSDQQAPQSGSSIDTPGAVPAGYADSESARFEQALWKQFWDIASEPDLAQEMGVRVAQGEAVYQRVKKGQTFKLIIDAVGGMNMTPSSPAAGS